MLFRIAKGPGYQGQNIRGYRGESAPPHLENLLFQCNVLLQGNLLGRGPFDQLLLLKTRSQKIFTGETSDTPLTYIEATPPPSWLTLYEEEGLTSR